MSPALDDRSTGRPMDAAGFGSAPRDEPARPVASLQWIAAAAATARALGLDRIGDELEGEALVADTVVLLPARDRPDASWAAAIAARLAASRLRHLVLVSSAEIVEPSHRHAGFSNEHGLRARRPTNAVARSWMELEERVVQALGESITRCTILRPTAMPVAAGRDLWSRLVSRRVALVPAGFDPSVQWLEPAALLRVIRRLSLSEPPTTDSPRILHVAPPDVEPLRAALRRRGVLAIPVPTLLVRLVKRLAGARPDEAAYLRYPWTVSGRAAERCMEAAPPSSTGPEHRPAPDPLDVND
ncbi:MAG: hypothetical protein AAGE94_04490, partial [Acidobacteriota bacterium]